MADISAKDVMALRQRTGLGMMDCKKALIEAGGNMTQAEDDLKAKLKGKMDTRTDRPAAEGRLAVQADGHAAVAMIELNTETDFTARNDEFGEAAGKIAQIAINGAAGEISPNGEMDAIIDAVRIKTGENASFRRGVKIEGGCCGYYLHHDNLKGVAIKFSGDVDDETINGICQHIAFADPKGIDADDIPAADLEEIRSQAREEGKASGKPDEIIEKMAEGKVRRHLQDITLINQKYVKDDKVAIKDLLPDGVKIEAFHRYVVGL